MPIGKHTSISLSEDATCLQLTWKPESSVPTSSKDAQKTSTATPQNTQKRSGTQSTTCGCRGGRGDSQRPVKHAGGSGRIVVRCHEEDVAMLMAWRDTLLRAKSEEGVLGARLRQTATMMQTVMPCVKTMIGMSQVIGGIPFACAVRYPDAFSEIIEFLQIFSLDVFSFIDLGCAGRSQPIDYIILPPSRNLLAIPIALCCGSYSCR
eukprot:COSAG05_NODE_1764_length_4122_cov_3.430524_1_plen_207_part_00